MRLNPKDPQTNPEDHPEDGSVHPEDSGGIPRIRRPYHLSEEGRGRLSELGKFRWASGEEAAAREAELEERELRVEQAEQTPKEVRLRAMFEERIQSLPEVTARTILRVNGTDFRIEDGRLKWLLFPNGKKTTFEEGQWFRYEGRAYRVSGGVLRSIPSSEVLANLLGEDD